MRWFHTAFVALAAGFGGAALWSLTGLGQGDSTREYLLAHPEVLTEAFTVLQDREQQARIAPWRGQLETPFAGAVLGNPEGAVTLVEFSDYACGYCRQSVADVEALIAANPDLRVVVREYPILGPESIEAARMALAAAQQGKYPAFHRAMFRLGPPSPESIGAAAQEAGLDLEQARTAIESGQFDTQLQANVDLASQLGINGTPAFIVGEQALVGAVGQRAIGEAIEQVRES